MRHRPPGGKLEIDDGSGVWRGRALGRTKEPAFIEVEYQLSEYVAASGGRLPPAAAISITAGVLAYHLWSRCTDSPVPLAPNLESVLIRLRRHRCPEVIEVSSEPSAQSYSIAVVLDLWFLLAAGRRRSGENSLPATSALINHTFERWARGPVALERIRQWLQPTTELEFLTELDDLLRVQTGMPIVIKPTVRLTLPEWRDMDPLSR